VARTAAAVVKRILDDFLGFWWFLKNEVVLFGLKEWMKA
jgi:hypothetical protein